MPVGSQGFANQYEKPLGYQQITGMSAATNLTPPAGATMAVIYIEVAGIRWRDDGTAPTGTIGMPVSAGQDFSYSGNMIAFQMIQTAAGAIANVTYYG